MVYMNLVCVFVFYVGLSVVLANPDEWTFSDDVLASSPLIQRLLEQSAKQADEIETLKAEVTQQRMDMETLRLKLDTKDTLIQTLLRHVGETDTADEGKLPRNDEAEEDSDKEAELVSEGTQALEQREDTVNRIRRVENEAPVAFSASLTNHLIHVGDHQTIVFDHVETNVGNAYNPHYGAFTAPVSGIYLFTTNILSYNKGDRRAFLTVNNVPKALLQMYDTSLHAMSSQTMIFVLNQGDDVSIQGRTGDNYHGTGPPSYTTFSGFLIQQTYTGNTPIVG